MRMSILPVIGGHKSLKRVAETFSNETNVLEKTLEKLTGGGSSLFILPTFLHMYVYFFLLWT